MSKISLVAVFVIASLGSTNIYSLSCDECQRMQGEMTHSSVAAMSMAGTCARICGNESSSSYNTPTAPVLTSPDQALAYGLQMCMAGEKQLCDFVMVIYANRCNEGDKTACNTISYVVNNSPIGKEYLAK